MIFFKYLDSPNISNMKVFRKIRRSSIQEGKLRKYVTYAVGEIFLIVVGILLAFQVNSWNNRLTKSKAESIYYINIKRQIIDDKNLIIGNLDYNKRYLEQYRFATKIIEDNDRDQMDTLGYIALNLTKYSDVNRSSNIYQSLVNSGELTLITNPEVVEKLQKLEETYSYMNRMEKIHLDAILLSIVNELNVVMKYSDRSVQRPDKLYNYEFQNNFFAMMGIMIEKEVIYNQAIDEIDVIIKLIDEELE